jgi:hypothetical protein
MGQHDRDVERHLHVAEPAVVPGHEEPAHDSPSGNELGDDERARRTLHGRRSSVTCREIEGGKRCGTPSKYSAT